ncbi:hypothetical protein JCM10296v2_003328 [Rhodotorula toruloides]
MRCTRCLAESGIDLFFCSPECQKLVWRGHKLFCGANAFPLVLPFLTPAEAETAIANLDKPAIPSMKRAQSATCPSLKWLAIT